MLRMRNTCMLFHATTYQSAYREWGLGGYLGPIVLELMRWAGGCVSRYKVTSARGWRLVEGGAYRI